MEQMELNESQISRDNLADFIHSSRCRLERILNSYHKKVPMKTHEVQKSQQIDKDDPPLPDSFTNNQNTVVIDEESLRKLLAEETVTVPEKFSDLQLNFEREQKLKIYEYVLNQTGKISEPELNIYAINKDEMSFADIVAAKNKETKLKRRKYRKSKPTHIEEVRGLVELQFQALQQFLETQNKKKSRTDIDTSRTCRDKNSSSYISSQRSRSNDRRHDYYNRSRKSRESVERHRNYKSRRDFSKSPENRHRSKEKTEAYEKLYGRYTHEKSRSPGRKYKKRSRSREKNHRRKRTKTPERSHRKRSKSRDRSYKKKRSRSREKSRKHKRSRTKSPHYHEKINKHY